jgi:hypothetical protein
MRREEMEDEALKAVEIKVEEIKAQAEATNNALLRGDYQKFVDLTYPKLVQQMDGRTRMISSTKQKMEELKAQGVEINFTSFDVPQEVVPIESQLFAIVPYTLKMKSLEGVLTQQSYLLAISDKDSIKWTFIDVTNIDEAKLKLIVPSAIGRLPFAKKQPPVFEKNP